MNFELVFVERLQDANTSAAHSIKWLGSPGVDPCWRMWCDEIEHAVTSTCAIIAEHTKQPSIFLQVSNGLADILCSFDLQCDDQYSNISKVCRRTEARCLYQANLLEEECPKATSHVDNNLPKSGNKTQSMQTLTTKLARPPFRP